MKKTLEEFCVENNMTYLLKQWDGEANGSVTPQTITYGSSRKMHWRCEKGHVWTAVVKSRTAGSGCPVCAGRKLLTGENDLISVRPDLAAEWHPEKNGSIRPEAVLAVSTRRVWWRCRHGHEWQARVKDRAQGSGCPVCNGRKVMAGENDLASNFPMLAAQWHPVKNGMLGPEMVSVSSNRRVWWQCEQGHEWQANVYARTREQTGCPYCMNRKVLAGFNDLAAMEPKIAGQWHPTMNGSLTPEQVTVGSRKKVWWICPEGHVWKTVIYARTGPKRTGCPVCAGNVKQKRRLQYEEMSREKS